MNNIGIRAIKQQQESIDKRASSTKRELQNCNKRKRKSDERKEKKNVLADFLALFSLFPRGVGAGRSLSSRVVSMCDLEAIV